MVCSDCCNTSDNCAKPGGNCCADGRLNITSKGETLPFQLNLDTISLATVDRWMTQRPASAGCLSVHAFSISYSSCCTCWLAFSTLPCVEDAFTAPWTCTIVGQNCLKDVTIACRSMSENPMQPKGDWCISNTWPLGSAFWPILARFSLTTRFSSVRLCPICLNSPPLSLCRIVGHPNTSKMGRNPATTEATFFRRIGTSHTKREK